MESGNPLVKLIIMAKLKKMINAFTGTKLKDIDRNMLKGIFKRKNKDFQEQIKASQQSMSLIQRLTGGVLRHLATRIIFTGIKKTIAE